MSMKKVTIILMVLAVSGFANAVNLLTDGDFERGGAGWAQWWGGNSDLSVTDPIEGDNCSGVWWSDDGIFQGAEVGPGIYEFGGKLLTTDGMNNRRGVIQAEIGAWVQQLDIVEGDAPNVWHIASPQEGFPDSAIIDNTTAGATYININLMLIDEGGNPSGICMFDEIYLGPLGISKQAKFPKPYNGETAPPNIDDLVWISPDPNNPADTISCDVYFKVDDGDPNFTIDPIATNVTTETVNLTAAEIEVSYDTTYVWRVDCTDPHADEGPVTTQGAVWTFTTTNDFPVEVDAGPDQYIWLNMDDGDDDPNQVTFTLNGQLTDDETSEVTTLWSLIYSEQDPATIVAITDSAALETTVTIDGTGLYEFQLEADDEYSHDEDTMTVIVYGSACEAANEDPDDIPATYPDGHGDIDGDCDTDLEDFALLAASWLECMSDKLDCAP